MAEIILPRRQNTSTTSTLLLLIYTLLLLCTLTDGQFINRAPHFVPQTGDLSRFSLPENTPVGTPVYQLKGIDPENGKLRYSISGQYFTVDSATGLIVLAQTLDREEQSSLEVIISLTDEAISNSEPNTISLRRIIPVTDYNDNAPAFVNRPYHLNISEDFPVGREIEISPSIIVEDRDEGINSELKVICDADGDIGDSDSCATFRVIPEKIGEGRYQVHLYLKQALDFESRSTYIMSLLATDSAEKPLKSSASIAITISDIQDQPPIFINPPYSATLRENAVMGQKVVDITAKDGDSANPRPILLTIEEENLGYFEIVQEDTSGKGTIVTTAVPIDRETPEIIQNGGVYTFKVKATEFSNGDPSDFSLTQVTIVVTDDDDHFPEFSRTNFEISIPENIETGSPLPGLAIYIDDKDLGDNSKYLLRIDDIFNSEGVFTISPESGEGKTPITVKVNDSQKLDYDIDDVNLRHLMFDIVATVNERDVSSARVKINILDTNDNAPIFKKQFMKYNISENTIIGYKIADIEAKDIDSGLYGEINYFLTGFGAEYFKTDLYNGGLFVNGPLDYESQKNFGLTLIAKDGGGKKSTADIFVEILDLNDNNPVFELQEYVRTIREGVTAFEPQFFVRATDVDGITQGDGKIKYSIISDNINTEAKVFSIDEESGEIIIQRKVRASDTQRGQYEIVMQATDFGSPPLSTETRVTIRVGIPGNQRPVFKTIHNNMNSDFEYKNLHYKPMHYISLREDALAGSNVTRVEAHDPDGNDELLKYRIVSGSADNFVIDERTGVLTVSKDASLDLDYNPNKYEVIVTAIDNGIPFPETATTTIAVNIIDVNNKPPKFDSIDASFHILENTKVGEQVAQISAIDTDKNANLRYSIIDPILALDKTGLHLKPNAIYNYKNMFKIDEISGAIIVNNTLDFNQAAIVYFKIKVEDLNAEISKETQFDTKDVSVFIQPYTDVNPKFTNAGWSLKNPVIFKTVNEEQPVGSILFTVFAEDPMTGHTITNFKVINSETDFLNVDVESGDVILTKRLDYEQLLTPNLTLTVKGTSSDGSKYSIAKVVLQVLNINDNAPTFEKQQYRVSILESTKHPEQIVNVKAIDSDAVLTEQDVETGYSEVRYSLRGFSADLFDIDEKSGLLQIAPNKSLDHESNSVIMLEVVAVDTPKGGNEQLISVAIIYIDVLDINDNAPVFNNTNYIAVVPENASTGISIINITAYDPDEGLGGDIKYDITNEGEANGLFIINTKTGEMKTRRSLTGKGRAEPYTLVIRAQDTYELFGDTNVKIYIGDVSANDGAPVFIKPSVNEQALISEDAIVGTAVFQVLATDPDDSSQSAGKLFYTILHNNPDADAFKIDPISGLITTTQPLDRETKSVYNILVQVSDKGNPPQSVSRILKINITDTDDHKPRFLRNIDDPPIHLSVFEEVLDDTVVGRLAAIDEDIGANGAIDYAIIDGNKESVFTLETLNSTAIIKTANRIDRESTSKYLLTIKCFKLGNDLRRPEKAYNKEDLSEIQVLVSVFDIDDHLPDFGENRTILSVRLNTPVDTVIHKFKAMDKDPDAGPMKYFIVNATCEINKQNGVKVKNVRHGLNISKYMSLDEDNGKLIIVGKLTKHTDHIIRLKVRAKNSETIKRYKDLDVEIHVVRSRDLLRLDWNGGSSRAEKLTHTLKDVLSESGLKLVAQPPAAALMDDGSFDYTTTSICFQLHANGTLLDAEQSEKLLKELSIPLENTSGQISRCVNRKNKLVGLCEGALLLTAVALLLAAIIALIVLACAKKRLRKQNKKSLVSRGVPTSAAYLAAPTPGSLRMYSEPIYAT